VEGWSKGNAAGLAVWGLWLMFECEVLLVGHYEVRTHLRALFGLPIYHILLTFLALVGIERMFSTRRDWLVFHVRWNGFWLTVHLLLYWQISIHLEEWWRRGQGASLPQLICFWSGLGASLVGSWVAAWLPISAWWKTLREQWSWLRWALPVSLAAPHGIENVSNGWQTISGWTMSLTRLGLTLFYDPVVCQPETLELGTESFVIEVLPGCSGLEGMGLLALFISSYLWVRRDHLKFPRSLVLVPAGVALAYMANLLRLVVLIVIGTEISPSIALRGFHSQAGWISFTCLALVLIATVERFPWFHRVQAAPELEQEGFAYPALPFLMPMAALLVATMVVQATTGRFAYSYFLKPLLGGAVLMNYFPKYRTILRRPGRMALMTGVFAWLLWVALVHPAESVSPYQALAGGWAEAWICLRILGGSVVVPLAEELAFRGYLMSRLQGEPFEANVGRTTPRALLLSSLAFGCLHEEWVAGTCAGLAYGWVSTRPGGLANSVVAHSLTNLLLAIQAVAFKQWGLW